ncbi:MAG: hypothetical protein A2145_04315 [candidate division Zixibacteria bacterium RBG_16_40_9]|nr:MAG: hypothetical protein A2145_04315 [candidate division Zixibacteria bacterium RBG_16_40_9]
MGKKVLIADKSITIRSIAESLLRQKGHEVFTASDQEKAFSIIKQYHPDLIFLDYSLPSVNLQVFLQTLKSEPEVKKIPLVLLLPVAELKNQESLIQKENLSYLIKPFTPKELIVKTEEFLKLAAASTPETPSPTKRGSVDLMGEASTKEVDAFFASLLKEEEAGAKTEKVSTPDEEELILSTSFAESSPEEEIEEKEMPHDYEWFINEMKNKEEQKSGEKKKTSPKSSAKTEKTEKKEEAPETKKLDVKVEEMGTSKLKMDKLLAKIKEEEEAEAESLSGYAHLKNDKATKVEEKVKTKKSPSEAIIPTNSKEIKTPELPSGMDYDKMAEHLVDEVSEKLAKEIVKKIDKESVAKMLKEKIEKLDFKIS